MVVGIVILLATITWFMNARKDYVSPEIAELNAQKVENSSREVVAEKEKAKDETYVVENAVD